MGTSKLSNLGHVKRVTLACGLKTPHRSRAELARVWVVSQAVSELAEEPMQAPRLGSGAVKPRAEASRWRSRSPARCLVRSPHVVVVVASS